MSQPYAQDPVSAWIASVDGLRLSGGCDACDAETVIEAHVYGLPGVHLIRVIHHPRCVRLAALATRARTRKRKKGNKR